MSKSRLLVAVTRFGVSVGAACGVAAILIAVAGGARVGALGLALLALGALSVGVVGAAAVRSAPRNPVGWILLVSGVTMPLAVAAYLYAEAVYRYGESWPGARWAGWLDGWPWVPALALIPTVGLLLFPEGRPRSRVERGLLLAGLVVNVSLLVSLLLGSDLLDFVDVANPTALPGTAGDVAGGLLGVIVLIAPLATAGAWLLTRRWRASRRDGTASALGLVVPAAWLIAASWWSCIVITSIGGDDTSALPGESVGLVALAATCWVAIIRYGLFDTRTVVSRAVTYGALTAVVVGLYFAVAAGVDLLLPAESARALSVAVAVLVALPVRDRLQGIVSRLVYGYRDDPATALLHVGQRLADAAAADAVLPGVVRSVRSAMRLRFVAIELDGRMVAADGRPADEGHREVLPLIFAGETIGSLVAELHPQQRLSAEERRLLGGIARQVAAAGHAVSLTGDLLRSHERQVAATEEERRRLRRDLHDGLGPDLAGVVLGLHRARRQIDVSPDTARAQLDSLAEQMQRAVGEVRRLVYDLRPPALDEFGLVGALSEKGASLGAVVSGPTAVPELPAAVEVAAYRIALEAMTNASRHARAHSCAVRIVIDEHLRVEVLDDGIGLPDGYRAGVGIASMRERAAELGGTCVVEGQQPAGTLVRATIPLPR